MTKFVKWSASRKRLRTADLAYTAASDSNSAKSFLSLNDKNDFAEFESDAAVNAAGDAECQHEQKSTF